MLRRVELIIVYRAIRFICHPKTVLRDPATIMPRHCTSSVIGQGTPTRLDRDLGNPFGSAGYAREELRAEIASLIHRDRSWGSVTIRAGHAGYVDHWVQILTDTPKEILYAAADAERISEYILTIEQKKEIQHTQEVGR